MDGYLSNMPDPSNESGTNSEEPTDDTEAHRERELGTSPHHREVSTRGVLTSRQGTGTRTPRGRKRQKAQLIERSRGLEPGVLPSIVY
jgi:hypothetical protein